jgi:hypothetical protein
MPALSSPGPRPEQHKPALAAHGWHDDGIVAEEAAEIDHAVRLPRMLATEKPRLRHRHGRDRRDRDHLAGVGEPDQPLRSAARKAEARRFHLRRGLADEAGCELRWNERRSSFAARAMVMQCGFAVS